MHRAALWPAVDALIDRAPSLSGLRAHGLHLLAAQRLRRLGRTVPEGLVAEEHNAAAIGLLVPGVLSAVRAAWDGDIVLVKGPEAAATYPSAATRPFADLDLLVDHAPEAHDAMKRAGFVEVGDPRLYEKIHHLRPLVLPRLPLPIELHTRPKWVHWHAGPDASELLRVAVPGTTGVDGILRLPPAQHALLLTAHAWAHEPLRRALDLVDVAAVAGDADSAELCELAGAWGLERIWSTTDRFLRALLEGAAPPIGARLWGRSVLELKERTVVESHLESWLSPYSALPPVQAARQMAGAVVADVRRDHGDSWSWKLRRSRRAIANAFRPRSYHDRVLDEHGARAALPTDREVR